MQNLIEKKKMYEKHIATILNAVKVDVAVFRQKKMEELELQCQIREKDLMATVEKEVRTYETRIKVLTDIISEDMPEASVINDLISEAKVEEVLPEEVTASQDSILYVDEEEIVDLDVTDEIPEEAEIFDEVVITKKEEPILDRPGMAQITIPTRG